MTPKQKKPLIVIGVILGLILLFLLGDFLYRQAYIFVWNSKTDKFMDSLERPYREDTYGGKTPEETWALFFDAVKKGDIDLAVKYCDYYRQKFCFDRFKKLREKSEREVWIKELETIKRAPKSTDDSKVVVDDPNRAEFLYKYFSELSNGYRWSSIVFKLNTYTKIWKITVI